MKPNSFPVERRLNNPQAYKRVFDQSKRFTCPAITCLVRFSRDSQSARLGLAISKKQLKRAVDRNRVKRLIRESFRTSVIRDLPVDVVVMARHKVRFANNDDVLRALEKKWAKILVFYND